MENEEFLANHFEGENGIDGIPGTFRPSGEEDILLPIKEIDGNAPLDEKEPTLPRKEKFKYIPETTDLL